MFCLGWGPLDLFMLPVVAGMTDARHYTQLLVEMGSQELFAQVGPEPETSQSLPQDCRCEPPVQARNIKHSKPL
jgi:hypothetical protein